MNEADFTLTKLCRNRAKAQRDAGDVGKVPAPVLGGVLYLLGPSREAEANLAQVNEAGRVLNFAEGVARGHQAGKLPFFKRAVNGLKHWLTGGDVLPAGNEVARDDHAGRGESNGYAGNRLAMVVRLINLADQVKQEGIDHDLGALMEVFVPVTVSKRTLQAWGGKVPWRLREFAIVAPNVWAFGLEKEVGS